jgi:hypothetical protein
MKNASGLEMFCKKAFKANPLYYMIEPNWGKLLKLQVEANYAAENWNGYARAGFCFG